MRQKQEQVRARAGIQNGTHAGIEAAGEASEGSGGLNKEIGIVIGAGMGLGRRGEDGRDGRDETELDEGELFGAIADDAVLELAESLELDLGVGRAEAGEEIGIRAGDCGGGGRGGG